VGDAGGDVAAQHVGTEQLAPERWREGAVDPPEWAAREENGRER
jgi:hypothetical protein